MLRTTDRAKANADPLDYELWPCDRGQLLDDLWALGLTHIKELQGLEREINQIARLSGRNLEPWRAILSVALWLDRQGLKGLFKRLEELSYRYHFDYRPTLQSADLTQIVLRAVYKLSIDAVSASSAATEKMFFSTQTILQEATSIVKDEEIEIASFSKNKVGSILSSLRFEKKRPKGSEGRGWSISPQKLDGLCQAYGIEFSSLLESDGTTGTNGTNGDHHLVSFDDLLTQKETTYPDNTKPCYACGHVAWRQHLPEHGGKWYCSVCHPSDENTHKEGFFIHHEN